MKQTLFSNECISLEKQSTEFNLKSYREDVFLIILLKTVFENLNLVKSYDKTNPIVFVLNLRDKYRYIGIYIYTDQKKLSPTYICPVNYKPGRVAQSVGLLTRKSGVLGSIYI